MSTWLCSSVGVPIIIIMYIWSCTSLCLFHLYESRTSKKISLIHEARGKKKICKSPSEWQEHIFSTLASFLLREASYLYDSGGKKQNKTKKLHNNDVESRCCVYIYVYGGEPKNIHAHTHAWKKSFRSVKSHTIMLRGS